MKCPYNGFKECVVEQCPSCNYEVETYETTVGRYPNWMSKDDAIKRGNAWKETKKIYKFISCKLSENNIQPTPIINQTIDNKSYSTATSIVVKRGIF